MPLALVLVLLDLTLVIHAAKTGRFNPWGYVILLLPGIGGLAYVGLELLPQWFGSAQGRQARRHISNKLNPEKRYRELLDRLEMADTIANRAAVADECQELGKFEEAKTHYEHILSLPLGDDPIYAVRKARAQFGCGRPHDTVATLDELRKRWPDYQSADGHLLYARALAESGRPQEALEEYQALSGYYPGVEPRVRQGLLLAMLGRRAEAKALFADVVKHLRRAPKHARKLQAEWIAVAERELRG